MLPAKRTSGESRKVYMLKTLPARPDLEQLKKQAKDLLQAYKVRQPDALRRVHEHHPRLSKSPKLEMGTAPLKLSDAQLVIAREYGFESWPKLKDHVDSLSLATVEPLELFKQAFHADDAAMFRKLLARYPEMKAHINAPVAAFDAPVITKVHSREMLDVLLEAGADINARSRWWAGGFGLLDSAEPDLAAYAITRGAALDLHAAARLGMIDEVRRMLAAKPDLVNARGGDGQTPLHFAKTVEIAECLLEHGANIDAVDIDHESTPAQYMVAERQEVARYLVRRGCRTDLLMAAALGDLDLVRQHLDTDPASIRMSVSERYFPKRNPRSGGTIYIWTLGQNNTAHAIARKFGHEEVFELLMERSPDELKLAIAGETGEEQVLKHLLVSRPELMANLPEDDRRKLADAAQSNNAKAVQLMLSHGWPVNARGQHGGTALHWAAFHGNAEMVKFILTYSPPLEWTDAEFQATPLGWAIYGSKHGWYCQTGNYARTTELFLRAGAKVPGKYEGTEAVMDVIRKFS
jgi:hypothetical protein